MVTCEWCEARFEIDEKRPAGLVDSVTCPLCGHSFLHATPELESPAPSTDVTPEEPTTLADPRWPKDGASSGRPEVVTLANDAPVAVTGPIIVKRSYAGGEAVHLDARKVPLDEVALLVTLAPEAGKVFLLDPHKANLLGRGWEPFTRKIVIGDPSVSRRHCLIERAADGYTLRDCGSSNSTFVNGARVTNFPLQSGDEIQVPPNHRFIFISQLTVTRTELLDLPTLQAELERTVPDGPVIRMLLVRSGLSPAEVSLGNARQAWFEILDLYATRKRDYAAVARLFRAILAEGYRSMVIERALMRIEGASPRNQGG